jgi:phosphate transport system protein
MSHLEERLENDLKNIHNRVAGQADMVEKAVQNATHALRSGDKELAYATILNDHPINRTMRQIDKICHSFIAIHLPTGRHLRLLSSVIRVNIELERIGDYAVTIAREAAQLSEPPSGAMLRELDRVSDETLLMLRQSINAFNDLNGEMARSTLVLASSMEHNLDAIYAEMMANTQRDRVKEKLAVFVVFNQLKRVADQAMNLCNDTIFVDSGEQVASTIFNILFIDDGNSCQSQLAEAIARKNFPNSGYYRSAGRHPADALHPAMAAFMEKHGLEQSDLKPSSLEELTAHDTENQHILVSLQGKISSYFTEIPFHTSVLEWDVGPVPDAGDAEAIKNMYRELVLQINDLMVLLHGEGAS